MCGDANGELVTNVTNTVTQRAECPATASLFGAGSNVAGNRADLLALCDILRDF